MYLTFFLLITGFSGKFGVFPANLGVVGIVDGISLFTAIVLLVLNKYVYILILALNITPNLSNIVAKSIYVSLLAQISLVTIYHGVSLNLRNFTIRKFIAGSSMINISLLLIILINRDLNLTYLVLVFYLLFYIITSIAGFAILLTWKNKSSNIILNDMNVEIIYNPVFYCIFIF